MKADDILRIALVMIKSLRNSFASAYDNQMIDEIVWKLESYFSRSRD